MKADLKDGFARVSVTLLHAWALLKLSDCAKSCLLMLVADTWGVSAKKPGYLSSMTKGELAARMATTWGRQGVYRALVKLFDANLIFKALDGKLGINPDMLESHPDDFQENVVQLNRCRRKLTDHVSPTGDTMRTASDKHPNNLSPASENSGTASDKLVRKVSPPVHPNSPVGDRKSPASDTYIEDTRAKKRFEEEDSSSALPHEKLTSDQALEYLPKLCNEFIEIMHSKLFFSREKTFEAVKAVSAPIPKLLCALAAVFVAVIHGAKPRNITGTIADAVHNPHNWPLVDPIDMTDKLLAKRKADEDKLADYDRQRKLENEAYQHGVKEQRRRDKERHELAKFRREYALAEKEAHDENFRRDNPEIVAEHERKLAAAIRANKGLPPLDPRPELADQDPEPEKPKGA